MPNSLSRSDIPRTNHIGNGRAYQKSIAERINTLRFLVNLVSIDHFPPARAKKFYRQQLARHVGRRAQVERNATIDPNKFSGIAWA